MLCFVDVVAGYDVDKNALSRDQQFARGEPVAWNGIPAADDENLSFQAYYVRLNVIRQIISPLAGELLEIAWDTAASQEMRLLRRSSMIGTLAEDLIRGLKLGEITQQETAVGDWFIHSGDTFYRPLGDGNQSATIRLPNGDQISAVVRPECRITNSAAINMIDVDDISLVVGRRTSSKKFDLVVAGYRDPFASMMARQPNDLPGSVVDRLADANPYLKILPHIQYDDVPTWGTLASATKDAIERFANAVENEGAWRHLFDKNGDPAHETRHQGLFRLFSQLTFGALRIMVHPNTDHGVGPTDLTLALGEALHIVEFKKDSSRAKILHGLQMQLPRYMKAAGTIFGSYVVMCHENDKRDVVELLRDAQPEGYVIDTYVIDCRRQRSASKAGGMS